MEERLEDDQKCGVEDGAQECECHVCTAPDSNTDLFPPDQPAVTSSKLYPHLYNIPGYSTTTATTTVSSVVSSVASLSAALSSALSLTTGTVSTAVTTATESAAASREPTPAREAPAVVSSTSATQTETVTEQPQRPTSLSVTSQSQSVETEKDKKAAAKHLSLDKRPTTCNHKHNNPNAKELKKMMGHDCAKKPGTRKSKSSSAIPSTNAKGDEDGESSEEYSDDSEPEDSCSGSGGGNDKNCACCYCEVFGHGNPSGAPVPSNYPQMRERLRLLLSKKKRSNRAAASASATACQQSNKQTAASQQPQQQQQQQQQTQQQQQQTRVTAAKPQANKFPPQSLNVPMRKAAPVAQQEVKLSSSGEKKDLLGVDEIIDYIEGNKGSANDKKKLKKERQKSQKLEILKAKQEEERRRKAAEEAARKAIEEQERLRKDAEEKALKKSKKKAAQKAKKLAASGGIPSAPGTASGSSTPVTPGGSGSNPNKPEAMMELENMQLEHIRQQKELLEKQKRQLEEQQRRLDEELNRKIAEKNAAQAAAVAAEKAKDAANSQLSKKQAKKAAKKAAAAAVAAGGLSQSASNSSVNSTTSLPSSSSAYSSPHYPQASYAAPYQAQPSHVPPYSSPYSPQPAAFNMPGMYPGMAGPMGGPMGGPGPYQQQPGPGFPSAFSPFQAPFQSSPMQPQPQPPAPKPSVGPAGSAKSDQPMVTIKRVMRPDTNEPTVTISVKKEEGKKKEKEQVLFTLVNGQVMKTSSAPDNLIPSAVPMPKDLQKRILPEDLQDGKLSKKQKKKLKAQLEADGGLPSAGPVAPPAPTGGRVSSALPTTAQGSVDLDRLKLPDGVSISKISGPVPERKYFPCKSGPEVAGPQIVQSNPWTSPASMYGGNPGQPQLGSLYGAAPAKDPNVIVVDTNSLDADKTKSKKKKNKKSESNGVSTPLSQPTPSAIMPAQAPVGGKGREWTPAQYGGYVPPADGKGGGQVLIKSVNGKVVITPVPGTGASLPPQPTQPAQQAQPVQQAQPASNKKPQSAATAGQPPVKTSAAPPPSGKKQNGTLAPETNGGPVVNGNNNNLSKVNQSRVLNVKPNNSLLSFQSSEQIVNGRVAVNGDSANKRAGKHKSPELDDLSKIDNLLQ